VGRENRRKQDRLGISIPVRVQSHDPSGEAWLEMTKCEDASSAGASFLLKHEVGTGQVVLLTLPLPRRYRNYDLMTTTYRTYALVQTAHRGPKGWRAGVSFIGRTPPSGHEKNPGKRVLKERRTKRRSPLFLKLKLKRTAPDEEERTILENFHGGGARVMTALTIAEGEVVTVEDVEGSFRTRAEVCGIYVGRDGIRRLNLRFLDR
jgi:hypothetical protein